MNINFSEVFKKLRRERELTQEQAAEAFSVSTQAVSRWENGQTSPDITLLPIIAEYFGVSIETLLGVDSEKRREKHEQYMNDFEAAIKSGRVNDCIEIARAGLKDFPHSYELMNALRLLKSYSSKSRITSLLVSLLSTPSSPTLLMQSTFT